MFRFRVLLAWLLAFALPLQGYAAVAASWCDARTDAPAQIAVLVDSAQMAPMAGMSMPADDGLSSAGSHHGDGLNASCCHAMAVPSASIGTVAPRAAQAPSTHLAAAFESCVCALPDKPPRV